MKSPIYTLVDFFRKLKGATEIDFNSLKFCIRGQCGVRIFKSMLKNFFRPTVRLLQAIKENPSPGFSKRITLLFDVGPSYTIQQNTRIVVFYKFAEDQKCVSERYKKISGKFL